LGKLKRHLNEVINPSWNFSGRLQNRDHEMNAVVGLASEAGEVLDVMKKAWFHDEKPRDFIRKKLVLELGDVVYYLLKTMDLFDISMKEVLEGNRAKLESRHPELGKVKVRFDGNHIK
jgi:NTP pyrophosphatase (non-canonical NTP hydrolase)